MPRQTRCITFSLLVALALAGCQPAPATVKAPAGSPGTGPNAQPGTAAGANAAAAGSISGSVLAPPDVLVSQVAPVLPTAASARLLAVGAVPVAGASVVALDAQGKTIAGATATTDAQGNFTLTGLPAHGAIVLRATFRSGSQDLSLACVAEPAADRAVQADALDPSATLVAKKWQTMIALNAVAADSLQAASAHRVARAIASTLTSQAAVAAMLGDNAAGARAFDALASENLGLAQAIADAAGQAGGTWVLRTPLQSLAGPFPALSGHVVTLAGNPGPALSDGPALQARLLAPQGLVRDAAGNMFIADAAAHAIRKLSPDGRVTTVAGNGVPGFADGQGAAAQFNAPAQLALDAAGNLYVADRLNQRIRKVAPDGTVTTVAGSGVAGYVDGAAEGAAFHEPRGIAVGQDGAVYVADTGNLRLRKITFNDPARPVVTTLAGNGTAGLDDGVGAAARFTQPLALAIDAATSGARLYVADAGSNAIRAVTPDGTVTLLAGGHLGTADGNGNAASFSAPSSLAIDARGNLVVCDAASGSLRRVDPGGAVSTVSAGVSTPLAGPLGLALGAEGTLWVADTGNARVLSVKPGGSFQPVVGTGGGPRRDGPGGQAIFAQPRALTLDAAGNLYVADAGDDVIRKVAPDGSVTTFAGAGTGDANGAPDVATFRGPAGLCFDASGKVMYVSESAANRIRKIDFTNPNAPAVSVLAGDPAVVTPNWVEGKGQGAHFNGPRGIAVGPDGLIYVADPGNHRVRTLTPDGRSNTYAGTSAVGSADGSLTSATFEQPVGLAFAPDGSLYVSDAGSNRLRRITRDGSVSTVAGRLTGDLDAQGLFAAFNRPGGLAVDPKGVVYLADTGNHRVRRVRTDGQVETVAGLGLPGWLDGLAWLARFAGPDDVAVDAQGHVFVADSGSKTLRRIDP